MHPELEENLSSAGFRPTRQRRAVYDCLVALKTHPTAEEVFAAVRRDLPHISLATVYKALESLAMAGMACKIGLSEGSARYEARMDEHYHARCRMCGDVVDVEATDPMKNAMRSIDPPLTTVDRVRLEFVGVCPRCRPFPRIARNVNPPIH